MVVLLVFNFYDEKFEKFYALKAIRISFKYNITTFASISPINVYVICNVKIVQKAKIVYSFNVILNLLRKLC